MGKISVSIRKEGEKRGFIDNIIDKLEDAKEVHVTARACVVASFLGVTGAASTMPPENFSKVAGPIVGWVFFTALVDIITTPGVLRDIDGQNKK